MKVDAALLTTDVRTAGATARLVEEQGFDGLLSFEGPHDPFLPLVLAARDTTRITLTTAVAIAFARNPMTVAYLANDLQAIAGGRFTLGLGTQIRPHIERRFGQVWSRPNARMHEFVRAVRAIWRAWNAGERLDFRGTFFTHTLMPPLFDPGPNPYGTPRITLAGFGPAMIAVAGEVADGWIVHPLHSPEYVRAVGLPALARGLAASGRARADVEVSAQVITMLGRTDAELARARENARAQVAFYASTPAYRVFLDHHGWGDLQPELQRLAREGRWGEMVARIGDDVLDAVGVSGDPAAVVRRLRAERAFADRVSMVLYNETDAEAVVDVVRGLRWDDGIPV